MQFAYDQCEYKAGTKAKKNYHHRSLHQDIIYECEICGYQALRKVQLK